MIETQAPPSNFLNKTANYRKKISVIISSLITLYLLPITRHSDNENINISAALILQ